MISGAPRVLQDAAGIREGREQPVALTWCSVAVYGAVKAARLIARVIPAKAGIQSVPLHEASKILILRIEFTYWIPAFAGMPMVVLSRERSMPLFQMFR
jgi:hypothetical protein